MDLSRWLRRMAYLRPRLLVVQGAGGTAGRLEVQRAARQRGWPAALGPAEADIIVVTGLVTERLAAAIERLAAVRGQPGLTVAVHRGEDHRTGVAVDLAGAETDVPPLLDEAARRLRTGETALVPPPVDAGSDHGHDMGGMDHDMMSAAGLPLAERGDDRDGLRLDELHVPLGPALVGWPPGLGMVVTLQGDVVTDVEVDAAWFAGAEVTGSWWDGPWRQAAAGDAVPQATLDRCRAAAHLDSVARLLLVAGDAGGMLRAERIRDAALEQRDAGPVAEAVARLHSRLRRGRILDLVTRGVGRFSAAHAQRLEVSGPALRASVDGAGDARARWHQWLDEAEASLRSESGCAEAPEPAEGPRGPLDGHPPSVALLQACGTLLPGHELAAARLLVASFDPDLDQLSAATADHGGHHG